jgi:hypothetical protein
MKKHLAPAVSSVGAASRRQLGGHASAAAREGGGCPASGRVLLARGRAGRAAGAPRAAGSPRRRPSGRDLTQRSGGRASPV